MIKILAIGNSFSTDATRYLQKISGGEIYCRNLFIGGCSLERHWKEISENLYDYEYQEDASPLCMMSVNEALTLEDWDYITVQQVSDHTGIKDSYYPYLKNVLDFVKEKCPKAKIVFHRTWAYEHDSDHGGFVLFDNDQDKMYDAIIKTTEEICKEFSLDIIPVGNAIQKARGLKIFDAKNGGKKITRDGFHLSFDYGRYLAGLVWYKFFTGKDVSNVEYAPELADKEIIEQLKTLV